MKKIILSLVLTLGVLAGCATQVDKPVEQPKQEQLSLNEVYQKDSDRLIEIQFEIGESQGGKTLMEVVKANAKVNEKDGFINMVNDLKADSSNNEFIAIYVNGEMAQVGANDLLLKSGDVVQFKLEKF